MQSKYKLYRFIFVWQLYQKLLTVVLAVYEQVVDLCKFCVWTYLVISIPGNIFFKGEKAFVDEQSAPGGRDTGFVVVFSVFCMK